LSIGQLPLVVVCAAALVEDDVDEDALDALPDEALESELDVDGVVVLVVAPVVVAVVLVFFAAAVEVVVVADWPSRQANTPPNVSVAATLSAAAARRARAARGLRRGRWRRVGGMRSAVGSSMTTTVRTVDEGVSRAGLERSKNAREVDANRQLPEMRL
jgi:hypothetical protein